MNVTATSARIETVMMNTIIGGPPVATAIVISRAGTSYREQPIARIPPCAYLSDGNPAFQYWDFYEVKSITYDLFSRIDPSDVWITSG